MRSPRQPKNARTATGFARVDLFFNHLYYYLRGRYAV
jgi:hypothetical protein